MRFDVGGLCFTNASGVTISHDLALVSLSYLVAAGGSYTALETIERWRNARGPGTRYWQIGSAATLGGAIWSTHFIAILALRLDLPLTHALIPTLASLLIAVTTAAAGLQILRTSATRTRILCAGIVVGLGITATHYVGMAALRFPGSLAYTPGLWGLSQLVGIFAGTLALQLSLTARGTWQRGVAALLMGGAIWGVHYTGMLATVFQPNPLVEVTSGLPSRFLALAVALITLALMVCSLAFVATDRRLLASATVEAAVLRRSVEQLAQTNAALEISRRQFDTVLDNMSQGLTFFDARQKLIVCNRRYWEIYRLAPEQASVGASLSDILDVRVDQGTFPEMTPTDYLARREALSRAGTSYDVIDELHDGRTIAMHYEPLPDGGWVTTHEDVTDRRRAEAQIVFLAQHDALTGLPNRTLLRERLEQALGKAAQRNSCAVLYIDLHQFKPVNDTLGHQAGDRLLQAVTERLQAVVRQVDTLARVGGNEFAIVQPGVEKADAAELFASRMIAALSDPFDIDAHRILVGASVGVSLAPDDGTTSEMLLKNADIALYLAKTEGPGTVRFFEPAMDAKIQARRALEVDMRTAVIQQQFVLYYQPIVDLSTLRVTGFEALLRWNHPARGIVSPSEFISIAEETGLITTIGEQVLQMACHEAQGWPSHIGVAVNLSSIQFKEGDLVEAVTSALRSSGLRPERLELEITESLLLQNTETTLRALHQLRSMGITVALDDFGTGYSSLSYLRSFPFDKIKIDQSFVRDLLGSKEAMLIIRAVTGLGRSLHMKTTAEGVETMDQLQKLRDEGCTEAQGYFFSHPRPATELPMLIDLIRRTSEPVT